MRRGKHVGELLEATRFADDVLDHVLEAEIEKAAQDVLLDLVLRVLEKVEQIRHGARSAQHQPIFFVDREIGNHAREMEKQHIVVWMLYH